MTKSLTIKDKKYIIIKEDISSEYRKTYTNIYDFGNVPKDIWFKIKKEELRIAEDEEERKR
jgi:hypothetical protein